MKVNNYQNGIIGLNVRLFGSDGSGDQKNYPFNQVLGVTNSIQVVSDNTLDAYSIVYANTYFTGTADTSFDITLPASSPDIHTYKYIIMSTVNRPALTWDLNGASASVGLPTSLTAYTPICIQYNHSDLTWYISM
jgi:hypothetical protein